MPLSPLSEAPIVPTATRPWRAHLPPLRLSRPPRPRSRCRGGPGRGGTARLSGGPPPCFHWVEPRLISAPKLLFLTFSVIGPGHCPSQLSSTAPFPPAGGRPRPGIVRPRACLRDALSRGHWVHLARPEPRRDRPLLLRQPHPPGLPSRCAPSLGSLRPVRGAPAPRSNHRSDALGALAERAASCGDALLQGSTEFSEQGRQSLPAGRLGSPEPEPPPWLGRPAPPQRARGAGQGDAAQPPDAAPGPVRLAGQGQGTGRSHSHCGSR